MNLYLSSTLEDGIAAGAGALMCAFLGAGACSRLNQMDDCLEREFEARDRFGDEVARADSNRPGRGFGIIAGRDENHRGIW